MSLCKYTHTEWVNLLNTAGVEDFESLWAYPLEAVDQPNHRGRGWSQVFLLSLKTPEGSTREVIVKRQFNYGSRSLTHLLKPVPTFRKEFCNIQRCQKLGIPCMNPVFYGERKDRQGHRAILMTEYLQGYTQLDQFADRWQSEGGLEQKDKDAIIDATGSLVRQLHQHRLCHRHLYPKHILLKIHDGSVQARLIDLEGMYFVPIGSSHRKRDLRTFIRRNRFWQESDWFRFLLSYSDSNTLTMPMRKLFEGSCRGK